MKTLSKLFPVVALAVTLIAGCAAQEGGPAGGNPYGAGGSASGAGTAGGSASGSMSGSGSSSMGGGAM